MGAERFSVVSIGSLLLLDYLLTYVVVTSTTVALPAAPSSLLLEPPRPRVHAQRRAGHRKVHGCPLNPMPRLPPRHKAFLILTIQLTSATYRRIRFFLQRPRWQARKESEV